MPRGFAGEDEAGRANDPSGPGAGGGGKEASGAAGGDGEIKYRFLRIA